MNFTDIFKGKSLIALVAAIVVCILLLVLQVPRIVVFIIMFALGYNHKDFAQWVEEKVITPFSRIM